MQYMTECSVCGGGTNNPKGICRCSVKSKAEFGYQDFNEWISEIAADGGITVEDILAMSSPLGAARAGFEAGRTGMSALDSRMVSFSICLKCGAITGSHEDPCACAIDFTTAKDAEKLAEHIRYKNAWTNTINNYAPPDSATRELKESSTLTAFATLVKLLHTITDTADCLQTAINEIENKGADNG